jgi:copper(I)-binding protein
MVDGLDCVVLELRKCEPTVFCDIPAGKGAELKPGGFHVMLLDLKKQLKEGDTVPLTLVLEGKDKKRQSIEVNAPVRALGTRNNPGKAANAEHNHPHGDHGSMKH